MTTVLEMPLRQFSPAKLQNLQAKYPKAVLRVEAESAPELENMDENQFWKIIAALDWTTRDPEKILAPALAQLALFSKADIEHFHEILNEKLFQLDARKFAEQLASNRYSDSQHKHFSVDSFLYSRCAVVANGRAFFENVLAEPAKMPKEFTFESLLYLPRQAWAMKTGRDDYQFFPETWSETFSNADGWQGITPLKNRILNWQ